jgi:[protein-PII] uridylyltransferase
MPNYLTTLESHAIKALAPAKTGQLSPAERIALYKRFLKIEGHRIKLRHGAGAGGLTVARARATVLDLALASMVNTTASGRGLDRAPFTLVAVGGYGRGTLNPGSDVDLLFLLPRASDKLPADLQELVEETLHLLWDVGIKTGHACRSIRECLDAAQEDHETRTGLMEARRIAGNTKLYARLVARFEAEFLRKKQADFLEHRRADIATRHKRHSLTPFLQEPNVKEGCGGLREIHNMRWISRIKTGAPRLETLVKSRQLGRTALREIREAEDFLHRVRNELHYHTGRATDILTLQLQGVVATNFRYPQRSLLRRIEAFMRDYYRHTRNLYEYSLSLMETLDVRLEEKKPGLLRSLVPRRAKKREVFDGFVARAGWLRSSSPAIFRENPHRIMRLFHHCQVRGLRPGPMLRRMVTEHWDLIDRRFRCSKTNRETFRAILEHKGDVARILREMHRVGVLGRYLPEFGALDCLVQHEFFHRYTADEHTLRCIEHLDALVDSQDPAKALYQRLLIEIEDPYALYLALILHDTGRAENVREHIDGSAMLASRVCNRLHIRGARRNMVTFLVDSHLAFWRYATTRNIEDPEVVAEFARVMRTPERLDALLLFTYADSNGTNPEAWSSWKESLMLQLHSNTRRFLKHGGKAYIAKLDAERSALLLEVGRILKRKWASDIREHFSSLPPRYFRFREPRNVAKHIKAVRQFLDREPADKSEFEAAIQWLNHRDNGYTELIIATRDRPMLLERICCALASEEINILSADFFTRADGVALDIFRVCTTDFEPLDSRPVQLRIVDTLFDLHRREKFDASRYLRRRPNFLRPRSPSEIECPVRARIDNDVHPECTVIEVQALDRLGLLHDLLHAINSFGLHTVHSRICTEKGTALDTFYITTAEREKLTDPDLSQRLTAKLEELAATPEPV